MSRQHDVDGVRSAIYRQALGQIQAEIADLQVAERGLLLVIERLQSVSGKSAQASDDGLPVRCAPGRHSSVPNEEEIRAPSSVEPPQAQELVLCNCGVGTGGYRHPSHVCPLHGPAVPPQEEQA